MIERTSTKSLRIELFTKYVTNEAQKESLVGGSKSAKGGPYPLADLDRGGPNPRGFQIRCDTGIPGEKSGLKYSKPLQSLLSMNQVNILKVKIPIKR